jgi:anti-anti-sigma factor
MNNSETRLRAQQVDGAMSLVGEVDADTCALFDSMLIEGLVAGSDVDLSGVSFMDSSGLRVLIAHHQRLADTEQPLRILRPSRPVLRLLEITGLSDELHVVD